MKFLKLRLLIDCEQYIPIYLSLNKPHATSQSQLELSSGAGCADHRCVIVRCQLGGRVYRSENTSTLQQSDGHALFKDGHLAEGAPHQALQRRMRLKSSPHTSLFIHCTNSLAITSRRIRFIRLNSLSFPIYCMFRLSIEVGGLCQMFDFCLT